MCRPQLSRTIERHGRHKHAFAREQLGSRQIQRCWQPVDIDAAWELRAARLLLCAPTDALGKSFADIDNFLTRTYAADDHVTPRDREFGFRCSDSPPPILVQYPPLAQYRFVFGHVGCIR